jgi:hypothetical protein
MKGRFSPHFLPANPYGWLLRPPRWDGRTLVPSPHGMCLLLTTSYLLLALWPRKSGRLELFALAGFAIISAPSLLYYNDFWVPFGRRFALDGIALALLAASFGAVRAADAGGHAHRVGRAGGCMGAQWFKANFMH